MSADADATLIAALAHIVGTRYAQAVSPGTADQHPNVIVDDMAPRVVVSPGSIEQLSQVMAYCHQQSLSVIPVGGGTQLGTGELPERYDVALCLSRLDQIVAHEPDDMTVTVQAGVTLTHLQDHLTRAGQVLPLDPPLPAEATVGGILATSAAGPVQLAFRGISDHLLGIKVVDAQGTVTKAGGRVVKNVSGYEMGRIYTGSLGTLAIIVEATFKVRPQLEKGAALMVQVNDFGHADQIIQSLLHCDAAPTLLEFLGPQPLTIIAGYTGTKEEVAWQLEQASRQISAIRQGHTRGETSENRLSQIPWSTAHALVLRAHRRDASPTVFPAVVEDYEVKGQPADPFADENLGTPIVTCTALLLITQLGRFLKEVCDDALAKHMPLRFACHAGSGVVRLHLSDRVESLIDRGDIVSIVEQWRETAHRLQGQLIVESAPADIKQALSVWGPARQDFFLHQAIKEKMDPKRILNPGRFVGNL